jgi:hypothetical protein
VRLERDPQNPLPDNKLLLEEKVEKGDIEKKLQKMSSVETNKRLSGILPPKL